MAAFNFNIGIFGHVDSGKTALCRALSTTASTAAFDKNPQSQERGITLDLGFSSFLVDVDEEMRQRDTSFQDAVETVQITLVDCPGHASLFKTVIGGSQIIDLVVLVVDVTKGIQTQTAECLLLAEITCPKRMIVVLNKVDLILESSRAASLGKLEKKMRKALEQTTFVDVPFVATAAGSSPPVGLDAFLHSLRQRLFRPLRTTDGVFLFAVDHCFPIRGQGTVLTGTVLSGCVNVGDSVEIPSLKEIKKVKSIQVFRQPVNRVVQGDRCGICVTHLEARSLERGLVCHPGALPVSYAAVVSVNPIKYFKGKLSTNARFHVSVGHETTLARFTFFRCSEAAQDFDMSRQHVLVEEIVSEEPSGCIWALVHFENPLLCPPNSVYIAARLDSDIHLNACRLAFHGRLLHIFSDKNYAANSLSVLRVYKTKVKSGRVERLLDEQTVIVASLFKKETKMDCFSGLKVELSSGEAGMIEGGFGQSGKVKVRVLSGLKPETLEQLKSVAPKRKAKQPGADSAPTPQSAPITVTLKFKRFIFDPNKKIIQ